VIGVGIVGCNYGRTVLLPAFRTDPRCEVVALRDAMGRARPSLPARRRLRVGSAIGER
jgi:predicted dehydrogenase